MSSFEVELPAGGRLQLQSLEEVEMWQRTFARYQDAYNLQKPNDLVLLGSILTQQLILFRSQQRLNGMEPILDNSGVPTGAYQKVEIKTPEMSRLQKMIRESSGEIRALEKALGIDKVQREAGGQHTVANYVEELKLAGAQYGVHIANRVKLYEQFCMDLRWRLRLLANGDDEDRAYHGISEDKIISWAEGELADLEEADHKFAAEKGRLWVGRL